MDTQKLEFNWSYKDYELRACSQRLVLLKDDEPNETIDLVKWQTDSSGNRSCFSVAYWKKDNEGYYVHFVGSRPFEHIEPEDLEVVWKAMNVAQKVLDGWFDLEYMINE